MNCNTQSLVDTATASGFMDMPVKQLMSVQTYLAVNIEENMITLPTSLQLTYTGSLPFEMPATQVAPWWGYVKEPISGDQSVYAGAGVGVTNDIAFTDSAALLTTLSYDNLGALLGGPSYAGFSSVQCGSSVNIQAAALTSLAFPVLASVSGSFYYSGASGWVALTTLSTPSLVRIGQGIFLSGFTGLATIAFPSLVRVGLLGITIVNNSALTTLDLSALKRTPGNITIQSSPLLTTINLTNLQYFGSLTAATMIGLTTINLPALIVSTAGFALNSGNGAIANVTLGTIGVTKKITGNVPLQSQKLTAASVNGILALLVSLDGTNGTTLWGAGKTVNLSGGTSSAPTGQGIIDKATLIARTATVTTN